jgi:site-specific recombinase XerD
MPTFGSNSSNSSNSFNKISIIMPTSVKLKFRPSTVINKEGTLYYQVIHQRLIRQVNTSYKLYDSEWDAKAQTLIMDNNANPLRCSSLMTIKDSVKWDILRLQRIIRHFTGTSLPFSADDVVTEFRRQSSECTLQHFMQSVIAQLVATGHEGTAAKYQCSLNSFMRFRSGIDIPLDAIDANLMERYESWLRQQGLTKNGSSSCLRNLRAVYNRAVEAGLTEQCHPFRRVYTGTDKTIKRAVKIDIIRQLKQANLSDHPALALVRDLFMFSFYTRGMAFVDMAYLRQRDIQNGYLVYRRRKTGQLMSIRWEPCMQEIVDRYKNTAPSSQSPATDYLLPIIKTKNNERRQYQNCQRLVSYHLHTLSSLLQLPQPVTMYVARHSWASIAHGKGIPKAVISEALGHDNEQTTDIYLASIETSIVDDANKTILESL